MKSAIPVFVALTASLSACLPALAQDSPYKLKPPPKPPSWKPYKNPYLKNSPYKNIYEEPYSKRTSIKSSNGKSAGSSKTSKLKPGQGIVSINTASATALARVPGIGPKMADRIIQYRSANGSFGHLEDLLEVQGVSEKTLEKLRPFVSL